jgi:hypothetical protein
VFTADGEVLDRESRTLASAATAAATLAISEPSVYRAANPAQLRAILDSDATVPIHAGRDFVRTDRLFIGFSVAGASASGVSVTAQLLDRRGATLVNLPVKRTAAADGYQIDLPLASIAAGEFAIAIDAVSGADRARAMVPIRVAAQR